MPNVSDLPELLISIAEAGSIYALIALGFLIVLRPTGIMNFSTGEFGMLGATISVAFVTWWHVPVVIGSALTVVVVGLIGWGTERAIIQPAVERRAPEMTAILLLVAMIIVYREGDAVVFGTGNLFVPMPFGPARIGLGPFQGSTQSFLIVAVAAVIIAGAWFFFERTALGRQFEAVAVDRTAAALVGVNLRAVSGYSFGFGAALAALAGVLQAPLTTANFLMGLPLSIKGFTALVIGGVGRVEGAALGGFLLAAIERLVSRYAPIPSGSSVALPFAFMILFLIVRPTGLLAQRRVR